MHTARMADQQKQYYGLLQQARSRRQLHSAAGLQPPILPHCTRRVCMRVVHCSCRRMSLWLEWLVAPAYAFIIVLRTGAVHSTRRPPWRRSTLNAFAHRRFLRAYVLVQARAENACSTPNGVQVVGCWRRPSCSPRSGSRARTWCGACRSMSTTRGCGR